MKYKISNKKFQVSGFKSYEAGFTLMELVVAATIFVVLSVALMSLFNYILQINRRSEALRQASQGARDIIEALVKEVRNGQIDYLVVNGSSPSPLSPIGPCSAPTFLPAGNGPYTSVGNTYNAIENRLGIINPQGKEECIYLANGPGGSYSLGTYVGSGIFSSTATNPKPILIMQRSDLQSSVALTPANFYVSELMFYIRPLCDPYSAICNGGYQHVQPQVGIVAKFVAQLPTGETVSLYYQTSVSTNNYDVPH